MAKRHDDALAIQKGACNPSGIAHSIINACWEIRAEPNHTGTDQIKNDPAVKLMVHQLAFICGVTSGFESMAKEPDWLECDKQCREALDEAMIEGK